MRILAVSGGTKNGNNDAICKEALMGAAEQGAEIEFIRLLDLNLKNCNGCGACMKSLNKGMGGFCPIIDDFEWLRDKMLGADGIIFSMPVFEKGAPGVFHTILDRFGPRHDRGTNLLGTRIAKETGGVEPDQRVLRDKPVVFLGMGGTDYTRRFQCDCSILSMTMMWKEIENKVYNWTKCFIMEPEKVAHAHQAGINIAKAAMDLNKAKFLGDIGICPHCHSRNFYLNDNATQAICCVCSIKGEISVVDGKVKFTFVDEQISLASDTLDGKLHHARDIKNNQDFRVKLKKSIEYQELQEKYNKYIQVSLPKNN